MCFYQIRWARSSRIDVHGTNCFGIGVDVGCAVFQDVIEYFLICIAFNSSPSMLIPSATSVRPEWMAVRGECRHGTVDFAVWGDVPRVPWRVLFKRGLEATRAPQHASWCARDSDGTKSHSTSGRACADCTAGCAGGVVRSRRWRRWMLFKTVRGSDQQWGGGLVVHSHVLDER